MMTSSRRTGRDGRIGRKIARNRGRNRRGRRRSYANLCQPTSSFFLIVLRLLTSGPS